jgi:hypothetical protein
MAMSYGVVWREGQATLARGKLELLPGAVLLDGICGGERVTREIAYADLGEIRIGRSPSERIAGRPSLVLSPRGGGTLAIAGVSQAGVVNEIAERLASQRRDADGAQRVAVVVPLRERSREAVEMLLADGPPFDPDALELGRHDVLVTESEAIFLFESARESTLEDLLAQPGLWERAAAWHEHLAGPPRVARDAYHWKRQAAVVDPQLLPPGWHDGDTVHP